MYGCLRGAIYNAKADILSPTVTQNAMTGQLEKGWSVLRTIDCYVNSIQTTSTTDSASGKRQGDQYQEYDLIDMIAGIPLSKRLRVTNIRSPKDGTLLWPQLERPSYAEVFEVQGANPEVDPFGNLVQYKMLLKRAEVQSAT